MTKVVGVQFRDVGKIYYFDPADLEIRNGDRVIVETARGIECGGVVGGLREVEDDKIVKPLKGILRMATGEDIAKVEVNRLREKDAFRICRKKIREHALEMKLVDVEYTFDGQKVLFYFTADGRVDFRELVKDLAGIFRTRIELRQIGVRDETKMLGGVGICGKPFCCSKFLFDFQPVSIRMAKEQGKSLNPAKISGTCGRLMCCLRYETNVYEELLKETPKNGSLVQTADGRGNVLESNLLARTVKVRMLDKPDAAPKNYSLDDIEVLVNGRQPQQAKKKAEDGAADPAGNAPQKQSAQGGADKRRRPPKPKRPAKDAPAEADRSAASPVPAPDAAPAEAGADGAPAKKRSRRRPRHRKPKNPGAGAPAPASDAQ